MKLLLSNKIYIIIYLTSEEYTSSIHLFFSDLNSESNKHNLITLGKFTNYIYSSDFKSDIN